VSPTTEELMAYHAKQREAGARNGMIDETHIAHGIAVAQERAAATAKLKRLCKEIVPLEAVGSEDYQDGYVDGFADALGAVVRAWEEET
jgi:hypothetical protein